MGCVVRWSGQEGTKGQGEKRDLSPPNRIMDEPQPPQPKKMILEEPPTEFEIAVRIARRLWDLPDRALHFAASAEETRNAFVAYVKGELKAVGLTTN